MKGDRGERREAGEIAPFLLFGEGDASNSSSDAARRARFASTSANGLPFALEFSNGDDVLFSACNPNNGDRLKRAVAALKSIVDKSCADATAAAGEADEGL